MTAYGSVDSLTGVPRVVLGSGGVSESFEYDIMQKAEQLAGSAGRYECEQVAAILASEVVELAKCECFSDCTGNGVLYVFHIYVFKSLRTQFASEPALKALTLRYINAELCNYFCRQMAIPWATGLARQITLPHWHQEVCVTDAQYFCVEMGDFEFGPHFALRGEVQNLREVVIVRV